MRLQSSPTNCGSAGAARFVRPPNGTRVRTHDPPQEDFAGQAFAVGPNRRSTGMTGGKAGNKES